MGAERLEAQRTVAIDSSGMLTAATGDPLGAVVDSFVAWKEAGTFPVISQGALRATLGIPARTVAAGAPDPAA